MRKPIRVAMLAGAAGALTLGGTTAALAALGGSQQPQATASYSTSSNAAPAASPTATGTVSPDRARQIALQRVPGARVTETEFDHEHGRAMWEVDLTKADREYEVHVNAATGQIVSAHGPSSPAAPSARSTASAAKMSAGQARQIALQRVPGARVTETEFDHEHGRAMWEVDLTKADREYEVHVDAATGNVLSVHSGTGTEDAD